MRMIALALLVALAATPAPSRSAWAQQGPPRPDRNASPEATPSRQPPPALPADAVSTHSITVGGRQLSYNARAGSLTLTDNQGEKSAEIYYVAYTLSGAETRHRPITFAFNGGPGAAAAYLELGAIGPRVLDMGDGRGPPFGAKGLIDNPDSWLPFTDLVFIDPVGTGYSRAMPAVKDVPKAFYTPEADLTSLEQAVRLALAKLDRFGSPVYLAGESYGGFRVARLAARLPMNEGIAVAGVTMVSPALEFSLGDESPFNPLPWALQLPSQAAEALEAQGKLTETALQPAEEFALGGYLSTLAKPPTEPAARTRFFTQVAQMIGLPEALVERWNGRVPERVFVKEIGHDKGEVASAYDASFNSADINPSSPFPQGPDPILDGLRGPLTTAAIAYYRDELDFKTDRSFQLLSGQVGRRWDWENRDPGGGVGATQDMIRGLALDPRLKIMVAHGMTDQVTPFMASRYIIDHLPPTLARDRVQLKLYPGGHMLYLRPGSRAALATDAAAMYGQKAP